MDANIKLGPSVCLGVFKLYIPEIFSLKNP